MKQPKDAALPPEVSKPKLSAEEIEAIVGIVFNAPCPGGVPQADARKALIQKFIASQQ